MKRGFTLIELLVVIGMIAILTGSASSSVSILAISSALKLMTTLKSAAMFHGLLNF